MTATSSGYPKFPTNFQIFGSSGNGNEIRGNGNDFATCGSDFLNLVAFTTPNWQFCNLPNLFVYCVVYLISTWTFKEITSPPKWFENSEKASESEIIFDPKEADFLKLVEPVGYKYFIKQWRLMESRNLVKIGLFDFGTTYGGDRRGAACCKNSYWFWFCVGPCFYPCVLSIFGTERGLQKGSIIVQQ